MYRSKSIIGLDLFFRMFYRDERPAARRIVKTSDTVVFYLIFLLTFATSALYSSNELIFFTILVSEKYLYDHSEIKNFG